MTEDDVDFLRARPIIKAFGGLRPMAKLLGVAASTIQGWQARDRIPTQRVEDVLAAAKRKNIQIPGEAYDLTKAASIEDLDLTHVHEDLGDKINSLKAVQENNSINNSDINVPGVQETPTSPFSDNLDEEKSMGSSDDSDNNASSKSSLTAKIGLILAAFAFFMAVFRPYLPAELIKPIDELASSIGMERLHNEQQNAVGNKLLFKDLQKGFDDKFKKIETQISSNIQNKSLLEQQFLTLQDKINELSIINSFAPNLTEEQVASLIAEQVPILFKAQKEKLGTNSSEDLTSSKRIADTINQFALAQNKFSQKLDGLQILQQQMESQSKDNKDRLENLSEKIEISVLAQRFYQGMLNDHDATEWAKELAKKLKQAKETSLLADLEKLPTQNKFSRWEIANHFIVIIESPQNNSGFVQSSDEIKKDIPKTLFTSDPVGWTLNQLTKVVKIQEPNDERGRKIKQIYHEILMGNFDEANKNITTLDLIDEEKEKLQTIIQENMIINKKLDAFFVKLVDWVGQ